MLENALLLPEIPFKGEQHCAPLPGSEQTHPLKVGLGNLTGTRGPRDPRAATPTRVGTA